METSQVILVDEKDRPVGVAKKMEAHQKGLLHRAFSVFIFNSKGEMLLQQRALHKYHSGGLWTNACCSHPDPGEETSTAVKRRLQEEMGFEVPVEKVFDFMYNIELDHGLTEHEFDHVFAGEYDGHVDPNKNEVMDFCYADMQEIRNSLQSHPEKYTAWFHLAFPGIEEWWRQHFKVRVK
ncbi:MAG TPA: isopentenyl-diphosphate Delta-isomerase [Chitinophagaceae bacterium]|nr:isopentenyl-diphosphate Delta-isomerase [Chitinophagaceae bacterium]